jgi:hypothetical protein
MGSSTEQHSLCPEVSNSSPSATLVLRDRRCVNRAPVGIDVAMRCGGLSREMAHYLWQWLGWVPLGNLWWGDSGQGHWQVVEANYLY